MTVEKEKEIIENTPILKLNKRISKNVNLQRQMTTFKKPSVEMLADDLQHLHQHFIE